jgi:hypothetical protein
MQKPLGNQTQKRQSIQLKDRKCTVPSRNQSHPPARVTEVVFWIWICFLLANIPIFHRQLLANSMLYLVFSNGFANSMLRVVSMTLSSRTTSQKVFHWNPQLLEYIARGISMRLSLQPQLDFGCQIHQGCSSHQPKWNSYLDSNLVSLYDHEVYLSRFLTVLFLPRSNQDLQELQCDQR